MNDRLTISTMTREQILDMLDGEARACGFGLGRLDTAADCEAAADSVSSRHGEDVPTVGILRAAAQRLRALGD